VRAEGVAPIARVGTLAWADETGGELRLRDGLALLGQAVPTKMEDWAGRAVSLLRRSERADDVVPEIPSTDIATEAKQFCEKVSPEWLRDHCRRTYEVGALLGRRRARTFDLEILFVASMLHDVGLTEDFKQGIDHPDLAPGYPRKDAPCFAVRGAGVAQRLATIHGWPPARSAALAEAISLHLNVRVTRSRGVEAHLLNAASAFDVIRLKAHSLPRESVQRIEGRWPRRDGFCRDMSAAWVRESRAHGECRGAFLDRWMAFQRRIHRTCLLN
jgi:hypothetical protein